MKYRIYLNTDCSSNIPLSTPEDEERYLLIYIKENVLIYLKVSKSITRYKQIYYADVERHLSEKRRICREWQSHISPLLKNR